MKQLYTTAQIRKRLRDMRNSAEHSLTLHLKYVGQAATSSSCPVCAEWIGKRDAFNEAMAVFGRRSQ